MLDSIILAKHYRFTNFVYFTTIVYASTRDTTAVYPTHSYQYDGSKQ